MKDIFPLIFSLCFFIPGFSFSQSRFEGHITMEFTDYSKNEKGKIVWHIAQGKLSLETEAVYSDGKSYKYNLLINPSEPFLYIISASDKTVSKIKTSYINQEQKMVPPLVADGKVKTSAAGNCNAYSVVDNDFNQQFCINSEVKFSFKEYADLFKSPYGAAVLCQNAVIGFPLEMLVTDKGGKVVYQSTVTSVKEGEVSENLFVLPEGYNVITY